MTRLLRGGFYRLTHSAILLIALLVILVADVFLNSRCDVTSSNMRDLPMLCTMSEFSAYAESSNMSVTTAASFFRKRGQLESTDATDVIGVFQDIHPFQFRWVLAAKRGVLAIPIIFAIVFLALDFDRRSFNNALYTGFSRDQVYFAKLILLFVSGFLVSLAGICALTGIYAGTVFTRLPGGYVWSRLLAHALMDCAPAPAGGLPHPENGDRRRGDHRLRSAAALHRPGADGHGRLGTGREPAPSGASQPPLHPPLRRRGLDRLPEGPAPLSAR